MTLERGREIAGVILQAKIADGGMGSVWEAEDIETRRPVAIKFLTSDVRVDPLAGQRFAIEARTATRIHSPYVPEVLREGHCEDGTPYIVMELVRGLDLSAWVSEHGRMDAAQVGALLDQLGMALTAIHAVGIVHRDVKPENIIVSGEPNDFVVKLVDFGIAKSFWSAIPSPSLTRTGVIVGTPYYMSPEQLENPRDVDGRSDMWSLAVVAYWCLTGRPPFAGETFASICVAIQSGHFTPVTELCPTLPNEVNAWFDRALSRDPDDRFSSPELMSKMFRVATARPWMWTRPVRTHEVASALEMVDPGLGGISRTAGAWRRASRGEPGSPNRRMAGNITAGAAIGLFLGTIAVAGHAYFGETRIADHASTIRMSGSPESRSSLVYATIPSTEEEAEVVEQRPVEAAPRHFPVTSSRSPTREPRASLPRVSTPVVVHAEPIASAPLVAPTASSAPPPVDPTAWQPVDNLGEPEEVSPTPKPAEAESATPTAAASPSPALL